MADRNLDAFCADLVEHWLDATSRPVRSAYDPANSLPCNPRVGLFAPRPFFTRGHLGQGPSGYVYVAGPRSGMFKVGMSRDAVERCRSMKLPLAFALEVPRHLARLIETDALRRCGHFVRQGEWVRLDLEAVVHHVTQAVRSFRCMK